jgi:hypothetical protein
MRLCVPTGCVRVAWAAGAPTSRARQMPLPRPANAVPVHHRHGCSPPASVCHRQRLRCADPTRNPHGAKAAQSAHVRSVRSQYHQPALEKHAPDSCHQSGCCARLPHTQADCIRAPSPVSLPTPRHRSQRRLAESPQHLHIHHRVQPPAPPTLAPASHRARPISAVAISPRRHAVPPASILWS